MAKSKGPSRIVRVARPEPYILPGTSTAVGKTITAKKYDLAAINEEKMRSIQRYKNTQASLGTEGRQALADLRGEEVEESAEADAEDFLMGGFEDDPPADDTPDSQNAQDDPQAALTYAIRDIMDAHPGYRFRKDTRTWKQRVQRAEQNWEPLLPVMVDAYLQFRYGGPETPAPETQAPPATEEVSESTISVINLYTLEDKISYPIRASQRTSEALVAAGYIGNSPIMPSIAISISTLELFRSLRLVKASFSTEAFSKLLCNYYHIPYRRHYRTALADAYDVYLMILDLVDDRVAKELGRDEPDWRVRNSCPPCSYELEDEEPATFARMVVLDGNNSLKRVAPSSGRAVGDTRQYRSDYFLPRDFVNDYAQEVKSRSGQRKGPQVHTVGLAGDASEDEWEDVDNVPGIQPSEGDPTDGGHTSGPCATNWKAAASDDTKRMWGMFEETGIFACACRHAIILWMVDMVRSGELAKYGLAIVAKILKTVRGRVLLGYDIGCAFEETVRQSSLGPAFTANRYRFCVNAFHGYSHSYDCQVQHHPNVIEGMGIEDLETLEHLFSSSNELAIITRYASPYRRHVLINRWCRQWDHEKYSNLGLMLHNNYVQSLDILKQADAFDATLQELEMSREDLARFESEEREYFTTLREEDPWNVHAVAYVEALQDLSKASAEFTDTSARFHRQAAPAPPPGADREVQLQFLAPRTGPTDYQADRSGTAKLETRYRQLRDRVDRLEAHVHAIELELNIETRWQPNDFLYEQTVQYIATRRYQRALGKVQRLVILRLFELHKMNIARTGYKVRTYIAKNLQRRCKAIKKAVAEYNRAAQDLVPPRPQIDWDRVCHYTFLQEFALLRDTRNDLTQKDWSRPEVREAMRLARRLDRAREELTNCNREVRRLHTWIRDEEALFQQVLKRLEGSLLHGAVEEYCRRRRAANARNMAYVELVHGLEGFTGEKTPGRRVGAPSSTLAADGPASMTADIDTEETDEDGVAYRDDDANDEVTAIIEYLAGLTT